MKEKLTPEEVERRLKGETLEAILKVVHNPALISYVCMNGRVGLTPFLVEVEYKHFKPGTPLNEDLSLAIMRWPDDVPMHWIVLTVPQSYKELVDEIADKHYLSIKEPGMAFIILGGEKGQQQFPLSGPNIFMMEGKHGSAQYGTPEEKEAARAKEEAFCNEIFQEHDRWLASPEGKAANWDLNSGDYLSKRKKPTT